MTQPAHQRVLIVDPHPLSVRMLSDLLRGAIASGIPMMIGTSGGAGAAPPSALGPGTWVYGASMALGRRVLASNPAVNVFHRGFVACDNYRHGEEAMAAVRCPVLMLLGAQDQMTPPKVTKDIATALKARVVMLDSGHHLMAEVPDAADPGTCR